MKFRVNLHVNFKAGARDGVIVPDGRALVKFLTTEETSGSVSRLLKTEQRKQNRKEKKDDY